MIGFFGIGNQLREKFGNLGGSASADLELHVEKFVDKVRDRLHCHILFLLLPSQFGN